MIFNKSANSFSLKFVFDVIVLIIVVGVFSALLSTLSLSTVDDRPIKSQVYINKFLFSDNYFIYKDPYTSRVYPGIIDLDKFHYDPNNSNKYESAYNNIFDADKNFAMKFTLLYPDYLYDNIINTNDPYSVDQDYTLGLISSFVLEYNKGDFNLYKELSHSNSGSKKIYYKKEVYNVHYKDKNKYYPGVLIIEYVAKK